MAINEATIFQNVQERLKSAGLVRKVLSIESYLLDTLYELSNDANLVLTATSVTTTASTATVTKPTSLRRIFTAAIDGENMLEFGSMEEYEKSIAGESTPSTGVPTKIHEFNGNLYLYDLIADDEYTVRLYGVLEEDDVDDIDLDSRCREAVVWGVLMRLFVGGELDPNPEDPQFDRKNQLINQRTGNSLAMYERAKRALQRWEHNEPVRVKYHDV